MRWRSNRSLWPLLAALTLLLALAVDAPRNWQRIPLDDAVSNIPTRLPSQIDFNWPNLKNARPLESFDSPVVGRTLPPIEADSYWLEDFDFAASAVPEQLPLRSRFTIERLLDVRDAILTLVERMPDTAGLAIDHVRKRLPYRIKPAAPQARGAGGPTAPAAELEDFADALLESVRRSREGAAASTRIAMRSDPQGQAAPEVPVAAPVASQPLLRFRPSFLLAQLEALPPESAAGVWAQASAQLVRKLSDEVTTSPDDAPRIVDELQSLAATAAHEAIQIDDPGLGYQWLRSAQAVERRTIVWRLMFDPTRQVQPPFAPEADVMPVLNEVASRVTNVSNGADWREYLLLDQIAIAASEGAGIDVRGRRKLAQEVLSRMADRRLTPAQRQFVETPALVNLGKALRPWAMGPVDVETLAALIEHYEASPDLRYAEALTQLQQRLHWSAVPAYEQLAEHLDRHYRGANMRVALTADLMNRMMPKPSSSLNPVNERIAGTKVRGRSRTTTQVQVQLIPNDQAWQIALEARGGVYSKTRSETWPARVQNAAKMYYQTRKMVFVDPHGMHIGPAKAEARGRNELVGIDTEFDPLPILSSVFREAAKRRHEESRPSALAQVKSKVVYQARTRMDREANPKIEQLSERFESNILKAIEELALVAEPLEMFTTADRAVMELRLANPTQLAANSLRPLAPSDSLASVQFHESVLNNAAAGLGLDGRRMTLLELFSFLATRFGNPGAVPPSDMPARAIVHFAPHDAIHIRCAEDRLELVLNIREVAKGRDKIQNFRVHAYFRPVIDGLDVRLVRDGTLQFDGRNLRTGPRFVLHSVFGKLFVKDQQLPLLKRDLGQDPRLAGLMVTQLVITDGWIGLSLGPEFPGRTAWRTGAAAQR